MMNERASTAMVPTKWIKRNVTSACLAKARELLKLPDSDVDLVNMSVDPETFHTAESFRQAYWAVEMFSKSPDLNLGIDTRAAAMETFRGAEVACAESNSRLVDLFNRTDVPEHIRTILWNARMRLENLFHDFTVDELAQAAKWGPGASTSLPRKKATAQNKWTARVHCTQAALPYLMAYSAWTGWTFPEVQIVSGNRVDFVNKNAKTMRGIAIEPDINSFFQAGVGWAIRTRAKRVGLLHRDADVRHQKLAREGSITGVHATIDAITSSDTWCTAAIEALVPEKLLSHLLALRSPVGVIDQDGKEELISYEKISSMGNGYTFELQTVLYWSIAQSTVRYAGLDKDSVVSVFGDDIICPSEVVQLLQEVLLFCGIKLNMKKSFWGSNPFRESCGGHFFRGVDVKPWYVRKTLSGVQRLAAANRLRSLIASQCMPHLIPLWEELARGIPRVFRGPESVPTCLHDEWDRAQPRYNMRKQSYTGLGLVEKYDVEEAPGEGGVRAFLHSRYNRGRSKNVNDQKIGQLMPETSESDFVSQKEPGLTYAAVQAWYSDNNWGPSLQWLADRHRSTPAAKPLESRWKKECKRVHVNAPSLILSFKLHGIHPLSP